MAGAVPVRVMGGASVSPLARAPSEHRTLFPVTVQPGVEDVTLVTPAGAWCAAFVGSLSDELVMYAARGRSPSCCRARCS